MSICLHLYEETKQNKVVIYSFTQGLEVIISK